MAEEAKVEEEVKTGEYPKKAKMDEPNEVIGNFVVLWRNEGKQAAKCLGIDEAKGRVVYEMVSGPDKGKRFSAKYDSSQTVNVYDEESVILAVLDT